MFAGSGSGFPRVFSFDECFQIVETGSPEDAVLLDPGIDGTERFRIELVDTMAAFAMFTHQMCAPQEAEVLRDCGTRDRKGAGNLPGWLAAATEKIKYGAAGGIGQGLEGDFRVCSRGTCNRSVTHNM